MVEPVGVGIGPRGKVGKQEFVRAPGDLLDFIRIGFDAPVVIAREEMDDLVLDKALSYWRAVMSAKHEANPACDAKLL